MFLRRQSRALSWVALGGSCWEYAGQSGASSLESRNAAPAEEVGYVPSLPPPLLPLTHAVFPEAVHRDQDLGIN